MRGIFAKRLINSILIMCGCMVVLTACGSHPNNATVTKHTGSAIKNAQETEEEAPVVDEADILEPLYIVEELNMTDETLSLYSIDEGKQVRYKYNMTTKFLDKYGDNSLWTDFTAGTVVTLGDFLPASGALAQVQKSDDVWVHEGLHNYTLDSDKKILTIDGSNYKISKSTKIYSDNEKILLSNISVDDVLTVVGQDKEIISIAVTTGHGYIYLTNTELFDNSMIFIGKKIVSTVYGNEIIEVPEGTYKITVANDGWGGSGEYTVYRNETTEINLDELKGVGPSYSLITFLVTVPDTYVYLDGSLIDTTEPQSVRYGSHKLVVQCDGYTSWNKTLVVNSESATITLALESEDGTTSEEASSDESTEEESVSDVGDSQVVDDQYRQSAESSEESNNSSQSNNSDDYDYEVDYLSTISDLISNLNN